MNAVTELPFRQPLSAGTSVGPTDNSPGPVPPDMLAQVREIAAGPLAAAAEKIDREGFYPKCILQALGSSGAMATHLDLYGRNFGDAIRAMTEAGRVCGSTGFMMWCHDVCGLYLEQSGNPALTGFMLESHAWGKTLGGTGMSNPMKTFAGIESMLLRAKRVPGGYVVNGTLPWVSHIGPNHYLGAVCAVLDDNEQLSHEVMFLLDCSAPGVELKHCPTFSGMEGTSTWAVKVSGLFIGEDRLIADPVRPFIARIRASFILLQTGMGLGVTQGSIDSMWEVEPQLGKVNQFLDHRPADVQAELDALTDRILRLANTPFETDKDYLIDVLDVRAHASELSLKAAQSALLHQGARCYLMSAAPQRRVRESHFVAIVTPAIKHLRKEMARLMTEPTPAAA
jgi:alkylation response protein AidB-like acyl-CoA dehydrogenase